LSTMLLPFELHHPPCLLWFFVSLP
jgi:hypothetical protein